MPTYEVARGDTVWALTRRALTAQLGRAPTNREILEVVGRVRVPSGDVNLIRPGEQVTIPVGPAYDGGAGDVPPAMGNAPGDFVVPPRAGEPAPAPTPAPSPAPAPAPGTAPAGPSPAPGSPAPAPAPGTPPAPTRVPGWESIEDEALQAMLDERPIAPSIYRSLFRPGTINPDDYRPMNYASPSDYGELFGQAVMDALPLAGVGGVVRGAGSWLAGRMGSRIPLGQVFPRTRPPVPGAPSVGNFPPRGPAPSVPGAPTVTAPTPFVPPAPTVAPSSPMFVIPPPRRIIPQPAPGGLRIPRRVRGGETPTRRMDYDSLMDYDDFDAFLR